MSEDVFFRSTELDATSFPAWRDAVLEAEAAGAASLGPPRSYPGYPSWPLPRPRRRLWPPLDAVVARRRCAPALGTRFPSPAVLGRLVHLCHGITGPHGRGPVPSSGGLQGLELYLAPLVAGWLPAGAYHYDRPGHHLSQVVAGVPPDQWRAAVPSLQLVAGGSVLWVLVGDGARVRAKYGGRGLRFLLLEAGHLMQNVCLACASLRLATVPLGGFYESSIARVLALPASDEVLYVGVCGIPCPAGRMG
jgi:SagB-type dehydrogenase family enzyme